MPSTLPVAAAAAATLTSRAGAGVAAAKEASPSSTAAAASITALVVVVVSVVAGVTRVATVAAAVYDFSDALDKRIHSLGPAYLIEGLGWEDDQVQI